MKRKVLSMINIMAFIAYIQPLVLLNRYPVGSFRWFLFGNAWALIYWYFVLK